MLWTSMLRLKQTMGSGSQLIPSRQRRLSPQLGSRQSPRPIRYQDGILWISTLVQEHRQGSVKGIAGSCCRCRRRGGARSPRRPTPRTAAGSCRRRAWSWGDVAGGGARPGTGPRALSRAGALDGLGGILAALRYGGPGAFTHHSDVIIPRDQEFLSIGRQKHHPFAPPFVQKIAVTGDGLVVRLVEAT